MTSELEKLAQEWDLAASGDEPHPKTNPYVEIWIKESHQPKESFMAGFKKAVEIALDNAYEPITATVDKPTDYVVSVADLQKFIEGEK